MAAKTMSGYSGKLTAVLESTDRVLPINNASDILARLTDDGDFTTVLIQDTVGYEVVKVINHRGSLAIDRGLSGTKAKRFPVGSCVMFAVTDEFLKATVCETDCCENGVAQTDEVTSPLAKRVEDLPQFIIGGANVLLGRPSGFMLINGKKLPYFD